MNDSPVLSDKAFVVVWVALVGSTALLASLALIGAWRPQDNPALTAGLAIVLLALLAYGLWQRRIRRQAPDEQIDPRVVAQRERRGF